MRKILKNHLSVKAGIILERWKTDYASMKKHIKQRWSQVGKSTLLKKVFPSRKHVSLDDPFLEQQAEEDLKSFANEGLDYRHFVSYYRGRDKKKVKAGGEVLETESEIDLIIEENGILYPIEIKKNTQAKASMTWAFPILDQISQKERGMGAVICNCPEAGMLRENILQMPVWYI